ncbi:MAG TPA: aminotransferase [Gemmatimonadetes bacterium]|jgi:GMP synthase (glutamine-hydrolysing)|nr:aminotransferase [Gemmatimonadota bacterium]|tara:strand:+ start:3426 stop:4100 length:675 start_codon:yes stop_codon:yes gene_type:complete
MAAQEVLCFARSLPCTSSNIEVFDLLSGAPSTLALKRTDVVLIGGSGEHSVVRGGPWLSRALDTMTELYAKSRPTFASCWGFQAMAQALGGTVVTDRDRAEVGTAWVELTHDGEADPVFGPLGRRFRVPIGHEDVVTKIPKSARLLASSDLVENQAFVFLDKPIYATQFHPELNRADLVARLTKYTEYLPLTGHKSIKEFEDNTPETPESESILPRFLKEVLGD